MGEEELINLAYKIHKNVESELDSKIEESNLRRKELDVLLSIKALEKPTTPSEIAKHADIKLPLVSRILDSLVKRSILDSARGKIDRRQNFVQLTSEGEKLISSCQQILGVLPASLLTSLSVQEKSMLAAFLGSYSHIK